MSTAESILEVRHHLHRHPELSGEESGTSAYLQDFIARNFSDYVLVKGIGGNGFIATKRFGEGAHIAFRAELDALPVDEENEISYRSEFQHKSHACGHDGHMVTLIATMQKLEEQKTSLGTATFLFQPAEETGKGAKAMVEDKAFQDFSPDALIALHNIPGKPLGTVMSRTGTFACGSVGVKLKITGKTAHAAHPEDAVNPLLLSKSFLDNVIDLVENTSGFTLMTPIALRSGQKTFGTSPLKSILLITLRAAQSKDLDWLMSEVKKLANEINGVEGAEAKLSFEEYFPVTSNNHFYADLQTVCEKLNRPFEKMETPFRWSEDFSQYESRFKTHLFGLGSGQNMAPLHASTYDFPDNLLESGAEVFVEFYNLQTKK